MQECNSFSQEFSLCTATSIGWPLSDRPIAANTVLAKGGKIIKNCFFKNTLQQALFKQKPSRNSGGGVNTALGISGKYTAPRKYSTAGAGKIVPFPPDNAQNFPLQEIILGCSSRLLYFFPKTPFKEGCHHICTCICRSFLYVSYIPSCGTPFIYTF